MKVLQKKIINDVKHGENLDIYVTILIAIVLTVLGVIGVVKAEILSAAILATLAIIAFGMLALRSTLHELSQATRSLRPSADIFLKDRSAFTPFRERASRANCIWLSGATVINVFMPNSGFLLQKIRMGAEIRVLIFDPESEHLLILAEQLGRLSDQVKMEIKTVLGLCQDYVLGELGTGKLSVRLTKMLPGSSMVVFDPHEQVGQMIVEYIGYRSRLDDRPHFELDSTKDRQWFDYYLKQFDELWNNATPYQFHDADKHTKNM